MTEACPVCGEFLSEKVYQEEPGDFIEQVWLCNGDPGHQVVVTYGNPVVESVRDADGDLIPDTEWSHR